MHLDPHFPPMGPLSPPWRPKNKEKKCNKNTALTGIRTCNLLIHCQARYPLRHAPVLIAMVKI